MAEGKSRRLMYVSTAIVAAVILILAVILLQQPIQNKTLPPAKTSAPTVSTTAASGVGQTEALLNGNLGNLGSAAYVHAGFLYGTDVSLAGATNATVTNQTAAAAFQYALTGLSPQTAYYFRAWALGDGFALGSVLGFTTLPPNAPGTHAPSVTTDAATGVNRTAATMHGNLTDLGTATSVTVGFRYGTNGTLASATNVSLGARNANGSFEDGVTGLTPNTTYYVQAWGLGDGFANGSILSFTTSPVSPSGHHVPPGWAHARCPDLPQQAQGHGVRARCEHNETYGDMKKGGGGDIITVPEFLAPGAYHAIMAVASDRGNGSSSSGTW